MVIFFSYRIIPLFTGHFVDFFSKEKILLIGTIIESFGLLGILLIENFDLLLIFSLFSGIGGGLFATTILSMIDDLNKKK
jgi:MFS family permease